MKTIVKCGFFDSSTSEDWSNAFNSYEKAISLTAASSKRLSKLDLLDSECANIAKTVNSRSEMYLTKYEMQQIVRWKLSRGTNRPGFEKRTEKNNEELVKECTSEAFKILQNGVDLKSANEAIASVSKLFGIGVATATGISN